MAYFQCMNIGGGTGNVADVEVNGTSVIDPVTKIAEITSYKEVTESEYEAIPVAERESNGIAYFIKDLDNESVQGYPPLIYSDEEREIGVWRDGKPLYQQTVTGTSGAADTDASIKSIPNVDKAVSIFGICDAQDNIQQGVPNAGLYVKFQNGAVMVYPTNTGYANKTCRITIQYTKTTDTAGSGIWNGQGGIAHHYSTNETVVGTWIDGKPIYMRTFTNVGLPQNAYSATLDLGVEADTIVKIEANDSANAGNATIIFEGVYAKINKTAGNNTILNPTNQLANLTGATLTVYYTKNTD